VPWDSADESEAICLERLYGACRGSGGRRWHRVIKVFSTAVWHVPVGYQIGLAELCTDWSQRTPLRRSGWLWW